MVNSEELYNKFASYFRLYSKKRGVYLHSIDKLILANLPEIRRNILDVGCGDGIRGNNLFKKIKAKKMLMIDSSPKMAQLSEKFATRNIKVIKANISEFNGSMVREKYDIILCLWNVLGHIPTEEMRFRALQNMRKLLNKKGRLYIDVSNRYNIRYYGFKKVIGNIINDLFNPSPQNGDFNYKITINEKIELDSACHFFTPFEMENLIEKSKLKVERKISIDYSTGQIRKTIFDGHLFYVLRK